MMQGRLPENISTLINELKSYFPITPIHWNDKAGKNNFFSKGILHSNYREGKSESESLPIAIISSKHPGYNAISCTPVKLLRKKSIVMSHEDKPIEDDKEESKSQITLPPLDLTFIHTYFAYGKKGKISKLATGDIVDYIEMNFYKKADIREWIAQIILAIDELHKHNLVHRDIKLENILIFLNKDGSPHLKLADHDDIAFADDTNLYYTGTPYYFPKEMCNQWEKFSDYNKDINREHYKKANKKAIDCFALGAAINCIINYYHYIPNDKELYQSIMTLVDALTDDDPTKRWTILQAKQHILFGKTEEEINNYFDSIKKKFALKETFIDGYYLSPGNLIPEENDAFMILPKYLKEIVITASELNNQIIFIQTKFDNFEKHLHVIEGYYVNEKTLTCILQKARKLKTLTNIQTRNPELHRILRNLNTAASTILSVSNELYIRSLMAWIPFNPLFIATQQAIDQYIKMNKIKNLKPNLFAVQYIKFRSKHNYETLQLINEVRSSEFKMMPPKLVNRILNYFKDDLEINNTESFSTILTQQLRKISPKPFDQWRRSLINDSGLELEHKSIPITRTPS
jgi:serine/threonine protein kinase